MAVDDHGLEVLKKSGEEVVSGSKADYYLKTGRMNALVTEPYDFIDLNYNADDLLDEVIYKIGGSGGTTVATLTITYVAGTTDIDTVTKT